MTIDEIKEDCIQIDLGNVLLGDESIGTYVNGEFLPFRDENDVRLFYSNISLKELLDIYSSYNGLKCLKSDGESLREHGYVVDIDSLLEYLQK